MSLVLPWSLIESCFSFRCCIKRPRGGKLSWTRWNSLPFPFCLSVTSLCLVTISGSSCAFLFLWNIKHSNSQRYSVWKAMGFSCFLFCFFFNLIFCPSFFAHPPIFFHFLAFLLSHLWTLFCCSSLPSIILYLLLLSFMPSFQCSFLCFCFHPPWVFCILALFFFPPRFSWSLPFFPPSHSKTTPSIPETQSRSLLVANDWKLTNRKRNNMAAGATMVNAGSGTIWLAWLMEEIHTLKATVTNGGY